MSGSTRAITLTLSVRDADTVRRELEKLGPTGEAALQRLDAAAQRAAGRSGGGGGGGGGGGIANLGQAIGQAGFQFQDFAVQVQGGTSALTALSQQGSQLLGVFGTGGAVAGALLTFGLLAVQMGDTKTAAERLADAVKRQEELYKAATAASERYRESQAEEAQSAQRLTAYYASLSSEMRRAERTRLERAGAALVETQRAQIYEATSRIGGLAEGGVIVPGMPFAESAMAGIGGPGALAPGLQAAAEAVRQFREQGVYTAETIAALQNRLTELAARYRESGDAIIRQREELEGARPAILESQRAMERNAAATAALDGNARGAAAALGGLGAAAATQLAPLRDLARDLDKVNAELQSLQRGGLAGLEAQRRARETMAAAQRDLDQDVAERVRRGASPADARTQALDAMSMAERVDQARRLTEGQQRVQDEAERLRREQREREAATRSAGRAAAASDRRDARQREQDSQAEFESSTRAVNDALRDREAALRQIETPMERHARQIEAIFELNRRLQDLGQPLDPDDLTRLLGRADRELDDAATRTSGLNDASRDLGMTFNSVFEDAIIKGKDYREVLQGIAEDIGRILLRQTVVNPLASAAGDAVKGAGGFISSLFSGTSGAGATASSGFTYGAGGYTGFGPFTASAKGNAFVAGRVQHAFAAGGVVDRATVVPMALMGEAGPEAVVPLRRGPDGRLGVGAAGGGGMTYAPTINIDARGADAGVEQRLRLLAGQIAQQASAMTFEQIKRGGEAAKTVGRRR